MDSTSIRPNSLIEQFLEHFRHFYIRSNPFYGGLIHLKEVDFDPLYEGRIYLKEFKLKKELFDIF